MNLETLLLYTAIAFFYVISPGPAVFLAINNGITSNIKTVIASSAGNILGLFLLSTVSILGLGAVLMGSAILFTLVKIVGAAYLVFLGIKQWLAAKRFSLQNTQLTVQEKRSLRAYFFESFFVAVTNPKPILFFIALFPQFLNIERAITPQFFLLTGIFMLLSFCSLLAYGLISRSAGYLFSSRTIMQWFHRITGGLFIMMGISLLKLKNTQS